MIKRLAMRRYRCFRDWQDVELGQITLVYGENAAGKSALIRLLPWIAASRSPRTHGLDVEWPGLFGAGPREVAWRGAEPAHDEPEGWWGDDREEGNLDLSFGLRTSSGVEAVWRTRWWHDSAVTLIDRLRLSGAASPELLDFDEPRGHAQPAHQYRVGPDRRAVTFDGLLPRLQHRTDEVDHLHSVLDRVDWLGPRRVGPSRVGIARGPARELQADGSGAESWALADNGLLQRVSSWYRAANGHEVHRETASPLTERLVLRSVAGGAADIPFADSGEGLQHVFSVITAMERLRTAPGLLAVEEPESHLHPRLQAALAEGAAQVAAAKPDAQLLLETHSEATLLAVLRAGLNHGIDVKVLWIEPAEGGAQRVRSVPLDERLRPTDPTLSQAFETMGVLRRDLIEARRARAG
jgi:predicted ATPase